MDKLKTRVLFISLIILALVSISAVAAADSVDDDVISADQDDFDLSEETITDDSINDAKLSAIPKESSVDDDVSDELKSDNSNDVLKGSKVTLVFHKYDSTGPKTTTASMTAGGTNSKVLGTNAAPLEFVYNDKNYKFLYWECEDGKTYLSTDKFSTVDRGEDYSIEFNAVYEITGGPSQVTVYYKMMSLDGPITENESFTVGPGTTRNKTLEEFNNRIKSGHEIVDYDGTHYTFLYWKDESGKKVTGDQEFICTGEDYEATYTAVYEEEIIGNFTLEYNDAFGHSSGNWSSEKNYGVDFNHTFRVPADIPDGAVFLYWEREDNGQKYYPNSSDECQFNVTYEEFAGKDVKVVVNAVYDIKTSIKLEEITGYFGDVVDITAKITEDINNTAVPGGTATLTIDFTTKLSNGLLMAGTYTDTVDVDSDGNAVFKNIKLDATPGTYSYKVEYSGYPYNKHEEGINDYLPSEADSKLNILPLNTSTSSEDVSGTAGDKVTITADIVDQNGDPVQNGTAVLKVNGKEYKAEVKNGTATFTDVELPSKSTEATIEYLGNDYYNPSNTTIQITVTQPEEEPEEPADEPATPVAQKIAPAIPAAGNPIALVVLALLALISTVSFGRKK